MAVVADFDFQTLEPLALRRGRSARDAEDVMDVLAEARAEAEQLREAARAEGFAAGRAEALDALEPALAALDAGRRRRPRRSRLAAAEQLERRAVELGLALAQKVVGGALEVEPERVLEAVTARCAGSSSASASPCSSTRTTSRSCARRWTSMRASLGGIEHCVVQAERRVGRGGCIVRTPVGDVDARVETKLERAGEVVAAALGRSCS